MNKIIRKKLSLSIACLVGAIAGQSQADSILEELVVTAQKREQSLQDVSVSVAAFGGDTLNELGIQTPTDIANLIPNVSLQATENYPRFNIRGVQLLDFGDGNESPISFYIDEVYYGTPAGKTAGLFDIERAEVLRGPQGTLFGRNSTGGLVHFITKKPTEEFEASGSLELASDDEVIAQFAVSGGLSDVVRGRLAGKVHNRDGWQKAASGEEQGDEDSWAVRGMLEIDLADNVTALFSANAADIDNRTAAITTLGLNDPNAPVIPGPPGTPPIFPVPCLDEAAVLRGQCVTFSGGTSSRDPERPGTTDEVTNDTEIQGASLRLTWDLGDMELVSLTAYSTLDKVVTSDSDGTFDPLGFTIYTVESDALSQELRLSGSSDSMDWIVGAFYYDEEKDPLRFEVPNVVQILAGGNTFGFYGDSILETESWAVFGQTEFRLSDQWTVIAGLRYTDENKELIISNDLDNPSLIPGTTIPFLAEEEIDEEKVTGRFGLDWRPNDDTLAFLSISTGYKSGAFNANFAAPGVTAPSDSEEVVNYELGYKTSFLEDTLRFNAAVFFSDYSDLQSVVVPPGSVSGAVVNVGDADIYGLEVETTWIASENLDVMFSFGLLEGDIESDDPQFDGNELPYTPSLSANFLVRYTLPFDLFNGDVVWTNAVRYVDEHIQTVQNEFTSIQEEYAVLDTTLRWNSADSTYFVELFVKNVGDKQYTVDRYTVSGLGWAASSWDRVRYGGIRVGFDFE